MVFITVKPKPGYSPGEARRIYEFSVKTEHRGESIHKGLIGITHEAGGETVVTVFNHDERVRVEEGKRFRASPWRE